MTDSSANTRPADLLYGASAIADYLGVTKRAAYHILAKNRIPSFKMGRTVCAKRSSIDAALAKVEEGRDRP